MSFGTPYPYGTPGGDEVIAAPQLPPVYRVAQGNSVIVFLHVNGRLAERLRENVEDVVRVLGLTGTVLVAIIVREEGVVRDANASDLDFQDGLLVTQIAPGVVTIEIQTDSITTGMLQNALITSVKIADANVTTAKIADANVTLAKMAANSVDASKIVDLSVGTAELANLGVTTGKIADANVTAAKLSGDAVSGHVWQEVYYYASAVAASNSSTATYATAHTQSVILPVGTWDVNVLALGIFFGPLGTYGVGFRIASPVVTAETVILNLINVRATVPHMARFQHVSNGANAFTLTSEYRSNAGGPTQVSANQGWFLVQARRYA